MRQAADTGTKENKRNLVWGLLFCAVGIALNMIGAQLAIALKLPLYLDNVGTILTAAIGGYVPGIITGYVTNLLNGISSHDTIYYGVLTMIIAVCAALFEKRGWFRHIHTILLSIVAFSVVGGVGGSTLTWLIYGMEFGQGLGGELAQKIYALGSFSPFWAQVTADFLLDLIDKALVFAAAFALMQLIPKRVRPLLPLRAWQQTPLHGVARKEARKKQTRGLSLRAKIMILVSVTMVMIAVVVMGISFYMFRQSLIDAQVNMAYGVTNVVESAMDPDRVDEYLAQGEQAPGYLVAEAAMKSVLDSSPDIQYIYVYRIQEDGCHVVFDIDTPDTKGADPGEIMAFDASFLQYVPALLAGQSIEPVISNDTFGWLLTVYKPIYNSRGECACYAGVDISMRQLQIVGYGFLARAGSLFAAFFVLILTIGLWLAEYRIILPINSMALATGGFAYESDEGRKESVEKLRELRIRTGDEIENLYHAVTKTTEDTVSYIADVQQKNKTISDMQDNLISVLADMVESRDQYTGNHIKNTAAYAVIIAEQLRREGVYADQLTDEYIRNLQHSAPLHDVGKIQVSDTLLNKPGRLTDEEFTIMKKHTTAGREIIAKAAESSTENTYLLEAEKLAAYHHERWDGTGYPYGLKGEEIPLSARIMAVADVFDALISKRSYKDAFPIEKALGIIREGLGSHFDPYVAQAFLDAEAEVRAVAETHKENEKN